MPSYQYQTPQMYQEDVYGSDDSLTQMLRGLTNYNTLQGANIGQEGAQVKDQGMEALQPVLKYLKGLLGGDQKEMLSAISPETDVIAEQFGQIKRLLSTGSARGGARDAAMSNIPFQQQQQVSNLLSRVRPQAASQLGALGSNIAGLGLQEMGLGSGMTNSAIQALLQRRGQNIGETGQWLNYGSNLLNALL